MLSFPRPRIAPILIRLSLVVAVVTQFITSDSLNVIANQDLLQEKLAELKMAEAEAKNLTQKFYIASLAAVLFLLTLVIFFLYNRSLMLSFLLRYLIENLLKCTVVNK